MNIRVRNTELARGDFMTNGIQKLFAEYEKAFAALDIEKSAGFFADAFISGFCCKKPD